MSEPVDPDDEYTRFERLARQVVNTPKPKPEAAEGLASGEAAGESADGDAESEDGQD